VNGKNSNGTSRAALQAVEQIEGLANPKLLNDLTGDYLPIKLKYTPKDGRILVFRMHKTYKIEIPLFETTPFLTESNLDRMSINEYFYDRDANEVIA
jgi:hypothetical protein